MFEGQPQTEIDALMKADPEFKQLYQRHRELNKKVTDAELVAVYAAYDQKRLGARVKIADDRFKMKALMTAEEWGKIYTVKPIFYSLSPCAG